MKHQILSQGIVAIQIMLFYENMYWKHFLYVFKIFFTFSLGMLVLLHGGVSQVVGNSTTHNNLTTTPSGFTIHKTCKGKTYVLWGFIGDTSTK